MLLGAFLERVGGALGAKDGAALAALLSLSRGSAAVELAALAPAQVESVCQQKLARFAAFGEVAAGVVLARKLVEDGAFAEANEAQIAAVVKFMELFRGETNWVVPFLHALTVDTRLIASKAKRAAAGETPRARCSHRCYAAQADRVASEKAGEDVHDCLVRLGRTNEVLAYLFPGLTNGLA